MDHAIGDCVSISQFSIRMTTSPKIFVAMEGPGCIYSLAEIRKLTVSEFLKNFTFLHRLAEIRKFGN